jgi:hypothetical protein
MVEVVNGSVAIALPTTQVDQVFGQWKPTA